MYEVFEITASGGRVFLKLRRSSDGDVSAFAVAREFYHFDFSEGDFIDGEDFDILSELQEITQIYEKALSSLSYSPQSKSALEKKLVAKYGADRSAARAVCALCEKKGYIDEVAQALRIAENCQRSKKHGSRRIASELISKGYERDAVRAALSAIEGGEDAAAYGALCMKTKVYPETREELMKIKAYLLRTGHKSSSIEKAFDILREKEI